ncbi:MAG: BatD family protein [Marinagarivorans sp.]|nr:BatD family protein [Marinagarivorans sp.]
MAIGAVLWAASPAMAQERLTATPDRTTMAENETLTLTVRLENTSRSASPDFGPLTTNFEVLGNHQTSQYMNNNGQVTSYVQWTVTLAPKQTGKLLIPPLSVGDTQSQPITINVNPAAQQARGTQAAFLETSISNHDIFVQQEFTITVKLYVSENILDFNAESFSVANADIEELPRSQYQTTIGHSVYQVYELRFAVTPSASGPLEIPSYLWTLQTSSMPASRFGFNQGNPNLHRLKTEAFSLNVKARPDNYPANAPWLPARELTLAANWSQNPPRFTVGEPITRNITLTAKGLSGDQLPPVSLNLNETDFKVYPDQPKIETGTNGEGKYGSRNQSMAIVPNRAGQLTLPAVEVTWWNTQTNQLETASLPAETINVQPALATKAGPATAILPPQTTPLPQAASATNSTGEPVMVQTAGWWPWACAALLILNAVQLALWLQARKPKTARRQITAPSASPLAGAISAAKNNNAQACHQALRQWGRNYHPHASLRQALQDAGANSALLMELDGLDAFLFKAATAEVWNGQTLAQQLGSLAPKARAENQTNMASLYPV